MEFLCNNLNDTWCKHQVSSNNVYCEYKDVFGKPNEGIHSYRICGVAIVDVTATVIAAMVISYYSSYRFFPTLLFLFVLGIILHKLFCVKTAVNTWLFS